MLDSCVELKVLSRIHNQRNLSGRRIAKDTSVSPLSLWAVRRFGRVRVRAEPAESLLQLLRGLLTHAAHGFFLCVDQHPGQAFLLGIKQHQHPINALRHLRRRV